MLSGLGACLETGLTVYSGFKGAGMFKKFAKANPAKTRLLDKLEFGIDNTNKAIELNTNSNCPVRRDRRFSNDTAQSREKRSNSDTYVYTAPSGCECVKMHAWIADDTSTGTGWMDFPNECAKIVGDSLGHPSDSPSRFVCYVDTASTSCNAARPGQYFKNMRGDPWHYVECEKTVESSSRSRKSSAESQRLETRADYYIDLVSSQRRRKDASCGGGGDKAGDKASILSKTGVSSGEFKKVYDGARKEGSGSSHIQPMAHFTTAICILSVLSFW